MIQTIEVLENRYLLALNVLGDPTTVPGNTISGFADRAMAVSSSGSYLIASLNIGGPQGDRVLELRASRYDSDGKLLGNLLLDSNSIPDDIPSFDVSASMDADGDAVIAFSQN